MRYLTRKPAEPTARAMPLFKMNDPRPEEVEVSSFVDMVSIFKMKR
jgi:hypothetical protein